MPHKHGGRAPVRKMEQLFSWFDSHDHSSLLRRLYVVEHGTSHSIIPRVMQRKLQMSGRDPSAFVQQISIYVSSRFLPFESLAFNRVRAQPGGGGGGGGGDGGVHGRSWPAAIAEKRSGNLDADMAQLRCGMPGASDFCDPQNRTLADDRVGYLFNDYAVAFSNMGRLNPLHGVIATRDFLPLRCTYHGRKS